MSPGTVLFFEDFVFADGDKDNKLVIGKAVLADSS